MNIAMPGFGSIAAGRKVGYAQALVGLVGVAMTMAFGVNFIVWYLRNYSALQLQDPADPLANLYTVWLQLRLPLVGFAVFGLAWLWSLVTSLSILAQARTEAPPKL